ncbi:Short-chain dehydrogenase/reductase SDR [Macrophomina phaseolina MS6]|uniref:Short-chain dehydrogenase/reductase SDR n=1 Tax=Macrophomina phaseolina (strain MS6) TaxID=1126212 RepID=K2RIM4_MACPH|nr:Short-chain dehydrogenase/reductase SDR [Macrophomina phaseolina MS6]
MLSIKSLAIALGISIGIQATSVADSSFGLTPFVEQVLEPANSAALWAQISDQVHTLMPGITCTLASTSTGVNASVPLPGVRDEACSTIEAQLQSVFPTISCTGEIDYTTLLENPASANKEARTRTLTRRRTGNAVIDRVEAQQESQANTKSSQFISSCARAPHPGNCRACAVGYGVSAVGDIGVCAAAAYGAAKANHGVASPTIIAGFSACGAAAIGRLVSNINACWTRVTKVGIC